MVSPSWILVQHVLSLGLIGQNHFCSYVWAETNTLWHPISWWIGSARATEMVSWTFHDATGDFPTVARSATHEKIRRPSLIWAYLRGGWQNVLATATIHQDITCSMIITEAVFPFIWTIWSALAGGHCCIAQTTSGQPSSPLLPCLTNEESSSSDDLGEHLLICFCSSWVDSHTGPVGRRTSGAARKEDGAQV